MSGFFAELRRRKVYRVAGVYFILAAGVIQLVTIVFPAWELPRGALRLVFLLIVAGFPISVITAWILGRHSKGIPTPPASLSKRNSARLARCGPLSDPVQYVADGLRDLTCLYGAAAGMIIMVGLGVALTEPNAPIGKLFFILGTTGWPLSIWLLLARGKRRPVIYLRAFRTDQRARHLRSLLKASVGNRFLLSGIRPPARRGFWFFRAFAQLWTALRYAGSQNFDLEAHDRNWMARLLASYARTQFVFIDVRDVTSYVADEIRLSYLAMGVDRCIFIIDATLVQEEWAQRIQALIGLGAGDQINLRLLPYPGDTTVMAQDFMRLTRSMVEQIPQRPPEISDEAIAFAESHVPDKAWITHFWETDRGMRWSAIGLSFVLFIVVYAIVVALDLGLSGTAAGLSHLFLNLYTGIVAALVVFIAFAILVSYVIALCRAWRQALVDRRFRRAEERSPFWRLGFSFALMLLFLISARFGSALEGSRQPQPNPPADSRSGPASPAALPQNTQTPSNSWHGFSIEVPANWRRLESEDDSLMFSVDQKYACAFTFHPGPGMAFGSLPPADVLAQRLIDSYSKASPQTKVLETRKSNLIGIDSYIIHLRTVTPEGDAVLWIRVSIYDGNALTVKALGPGVDDNDPGLLTVFSEGSAAVTREYRRN
jgi:hypothetical protein